MFTPETFLVCSKFPLFKAGCNLWLYTTSDTLEDCLEDNYFQPRMNTKNQDSPEVGDIIQCIVSGGTIAYLRITGKTEKPYNITVEKTYLENEAEIYDAIYTAADKGEQLYQTGVWYAKMYSDTVVPTGSEYEDRNYADFSQVDSDNNPIIVIYECRSGVWVEIQRITPPTEYNGYLPVTSKFWDIEEQTGQQGGEVLWSYNTKRFTPFPRIISYDSINITGDSTVEIPDNPADEQIINKEYMEDYVDEAIAEIPVPTVNIKQSIDSEIIGTLTVAENGDVSGFSYYNYLKFPGALNMSNANSFEFVFAFTTSADFTAGGIINPISSVGTASDPFGLIVVNKNLEFFVNKSGQTSLTGTTTLQSNTKYYAKVVYDGTDYILSLSTDGANWSVEDSRTAVALPGISLAEYVLGRYDTLHQGISILHMADCYIKKDGILVWQGLDSPGLHQRASGKHEVIEFQIPSISNNYTWYRKYADGWVEQGGVTGSGVSSVTLPVTMADNNYTIVRVQNFSDATQSTYPGWASGVETKTTTGFTFNNTADSSCWEVKGMYAQS